MLRYASPLRVTAVGAALTVLFQVGAGPFRDQNKEEVCLMEDGKIRCQRCGVLAPPLDLGKGFIVCPACGQCHALTASGKVNLVPTRVAELVPFIRGWKHEDE